MTDLKTSMVSWMFMLVTVLRLELEMVPLSPLHVRCRRIGW